jgi:CheY-like chemotaxis protein
LTTTLLAVDDSKTMRKVLDITFAGEDYRVVLAENAQQALELLRSERPTVALVDAILGGDSGYDLCQAIKREAPGTGVIILSSKHQPYDKARGSTVGADDFMDKPFDTQQLIDKTGTVARKAAEAPAGVGAPPPEATPYRSPPVAEPAPAAAAPHHQPAGRSPTLSYGTPSPAPVVAPPPEPTPAPAVAAPVPRAPTPAPIAPTPATGLPLGVATATATRGDGEFADRLADMGLTKDQVDGVLALSREVLEQVVWEVVPQLAEVLIKEEIRRLTAE